MTIATANSPDYLGFKRTPGETTTDGGVYSGNGSTGAHARVLFGKGTLAQEGADSGAVLFGLGTSTTRAQSASTAGIKWMSFYTEGTGASGSNEGLYVRNYHSGAGTSTVQALRAFTTVQNVSVSNARGAHISLSFGSAGGTVTGEGSAMKATLHIPNNDDLTGTVAPVVSEIWSDGSSSDPANAALAYFRAVNGGDTTGDDDVDTDVALIRIEGHTISNGNLIEAVGTEYALAEFTHSLRINIGGTAYYIPIGTTAGSAT